VSVFVDEPVEYRPYSGYDDPSLPTGRWIGKARGTGNATGGSVFLSLLFTRAEEPRMANLYNVEQIAFDIEVVGDFDGQLRTLNMDTLSPVRAAPEQRWACPLTSDGANNSAVSLTVLAGLPLWLGTPNLNNADSGIRFESPNQDMEDFNVLAQGFVWGPRSVLAPGGPQRPIGAMFR